MASGYPGGGLYKVVPRLEAPLPLNSYRGLQVVSFAKGADQPELLGHAPASGNNPMKCILMPKTTDSSCWSEFGMTSPAATNFGPKRRADSSL